MRLAELEVFHSRPIAPTRRVALGHRDLPIDPAPGFGGLLLGWTVAASIAAIDPDLHPELHRLVSQLAGGERVAQPRLRHRFQTDRVGLSRSWLRLHGRGEDLSWTVDGDGAPAQCVLGAVYAMGELPVGSRARVASLLHRAMRWEGGSDEALVAFLGGGARAGTWSPAAAADPIGWAHDVLGLGPAPRDGRPQRDVVVRAFRDLLRAAHPDHGAASDGAAARIADLTEARRILLAGT